MSCSFSGRDVANVFVDVADEGRAERTRFFRIAASIAVAIALPCCGLLLRFFSSIIRGVSIR